MSEIQSEGGEMTFDQAKAAIEEAGQQEAQADATAATEMRGEQSTPDQVVEPTPAGETPDPGATEFSGDAVEDSFMGEGFNPDLLPDELKPGFKQLQAEWTRKTQTLAEQRKQFEEFGDIDQVRQANELYTSLQDPEFLKNFYAQLGDVVSEMGLVDAPEAQEPAAPESVEPPPLPQELQALVESDPELTPMAQQLTAMQQELAAFRQAQADEREALEQERSQMAQAAEIDRMVGVVREEHPEYGEDDWESIYDRAIAYEGDVLRAAEAFQADQDRIIQSYLAKKSSTPAAVNPTPGLGTITEGTEEEEGPGSLDDAQRRAEAYLSANDLSEFSG